jgi:hypothetical protein
MIFVFGSNEAGIHGAGAAKYAYENKGAVWQVGFGYHGESFAIPTKDYAIQTLPLAEVKEYVDMFLTFVENHPELEFQVTRIGCGLAGFKDIDIAPLFRDASCNCLFDAAWDQYLDNKRCWGTF